MSKREWDFEYNIAGKKQEEYVLEVHKTIKTRYR